MSRQALLAVALALAVLAGAAAPVAAGPSTSDSTTGDSTTGDSTIELTKVTGTATNLTAALTANDSDATSSLEDDSSSEDGKPVDSDDGEGDGDDADGTEPSSGEDDATEDDSNATNSSRTFAAGSENSSGSGDSGDSDGGTSLGVRGALGSLNASNDSRNSGWRADAARDASADREGGTDGRPDGSASAGVDDEFVYIDALLEGTATGSHGGVGLDVGDGSGVSVSTGSNGSTAVVAVDRDAGGTDPDAGNGLFASPDGGASLLTLEDGTLTVGGQALVSDGEVAVIGSGGLLDAVVDLGDLELTRSVAYRPTLADVDPAKPSLEGVDGSNGSTAVDGASDDGGDGAAESSGGDSEVDPDIETAALFAALLGGLGGAPVALSQAAGQPAVGRRLLPGARGALSTGWSSLRQLLSLASAVFGYSRSDDSDPLENETRRRIYDLVTDAPGTYHAQLAAEADVTEETVRYHARVLVEEGLVESRKLRGRRRLYPVTLDEVDPDLAAALADGATSNVLSAIERQEPTTLSRLAESVGRAPSTVAYHLDRLEEDGLITRERDGSAVRVRLRLSTRSVLDGSVADD